MWFNVLIFIIAICICASSSSDSNLKIRSNAATPSSFKSAASTRNQKPSSFLPFQFMKQSSIKSNRKDLKLKKLFSHNSKTISKPEKPINAMLKKFLTVRKDFQYNVDKIMNTDDNMERIGVAVDILFENKAALACTALCAVGAIVKILPSNPRK